MQHAPIPIEGFGNSLGLLRTGVVFAGDLQSLYLGLQRCPFDTETASRSGRSRDNTRGLPWHAADVRALGILAGVIGGPSRVGRDQVCWGETERGSYTQHDR